MIVATRTFDEASTATSGSHITIAWISLGLKCALGVQLTAISADFQLALSPLLQLCILVQARGCLFTGCSFCKLVGSGGTSQADFILRLVDLGSESAILLHKRLLNSLVAHNSRHCILI